jgi:hypothetical protein
MDQIKTLLCDEITRNMNDCIVIIPTYNEIENIESIIRSVLSTQTISYSYSWW